MSLVGSLEDLALGDILQIVSLSRKSGLLMLRSNSGEGRIVLCDGLVCAAYVKGESEELRGLLVGGGFLRGDEFDHCAQRAIESGRPLDEVLGEQTSQTCERIDSLRREHLERSVLAMFRWRAGEFSFEVRDEIAPRDRELMIPVGVNAQYLTMEATRLGDEGAADDFAESGAGGFAACDEDFMFSGEGTSDGFADESVADPHETTATDVPSLPGEDAIDAEDVACAVLLDAAPAIDNELAPFAADAVEILALASARHLDESVSAGIVAEPALEPVAEPQVTERVYTATATTPGPQDAVPKVALVVIDPALSTLEWLKTSLAGHFLRIHIFQRVDAGIDRIRQYLARSERPLVLLSSDLAASLRDGELGVQALVQRLKALSPEMPVVLLHREGSAAPELAGADGRLTCPSSYELADRRRWSRFEDSASELRRGVAPWVSRSRTPAATANRVESEPEPGLRRLRQVSERLRDPSSRGDVLSQVLDFAAECFGRVAIFMLRGDRAVGIAQIGLERAGGPDAHAFKDLEIAADKPAWFREVIAQRQAVRSAPTEASNRRLTELLGTRIPAEAYVAPIESGGTVAALLYADNLPDEGPVSDTTALEIVLHEAGLALDRALLERALGDMDSQAASGECADSGEPV